MKHLISFILAALLPVVASAFDAEVNGIYYNLSGDQAVVTYMEYDPLGATFTPGYKGNVSLPTSVPYGNVKVENGCKLNIRNRKSVLIKNRFECKLGGELQIK